MPKIPGGKPTEKPTYAAGSASAIDDGIYTLKVKECELLPDAKKGDADMAIRVTFDTSGDVPFNTKLVMFLRGPHTKPDGRNSKGNFFLLNEMLTSLGVPIKADGEFSLSAFKGKSAKVYLYKSQGGFMEVFERVFPVSLPEMEEAVLDANLTDLFKAAVQRSRIKLYNSALGPMRGGKAATPGQAAPPAGGLVRPAADEEEEDNPF